MEFWDVIWFILVSFGLLAYPILLFWILSDLFRNRDQSGWGKANWVIFLLVLPLLTALVYLIDHGDGMTDRSMQAALDARQAQESYIREVAGKSPADQIADAKTLLDAGIITEGEFDMLKAKALG